MKLNQIQVGGPNDCPPITITTASSSDNNFSPCAWVCIKCGRVYSPSTTMCPYCSTTPYTVSKEWFINQDKPV